MKPMDIIDALDNVDKGLLLRSEQPVHQRSRLWDGVKIAAAAALLVAVGIGGFLLLRGRTSRSPEPIPAYSLPVFETREPDVPPQITQTPLAYSANWDALQKVWAEEGSLLAVTNGIRTEHTVTWYGDVPEAYRDAIRRNSFYGARVCGDRLICASSDDGLVRVLVYDTAGKALTGTAQPADDDHGVASMTATSDRGFLFALGFWDDFIPATYDASEGAQTSEGSGVYSTVIKCGADGSVQWTQELNGVSMQMLKYCFEADGAYYFFGMQEQPGSGDGPRDVSLLCLNADGSIRAQTVLEGSRDDRLLCAVQTGDGFDLYVDTQSSDGCFPAKGKYIVRLDAALNVVSAEPKDFDDTAYALGAVDGETLLTGDKKLADFPYGNLSAVVDFGDRLLTVSEYFNDTPYGRIEGADRLALASRGGNLRPDLTVYAMFGKQDGALLWRAVTTAAPDRRPAEPDGFIELWDEETRPLEWLMRAPDGGDDEPGDEELYRTAIREILKQVHMQLLDQNRGEMEAVAEEMLRLQALSSDPMGVSVCYYPAEGGLTLDPAAAAEADVEALTGQLYTLTKRCGFEFIAAIPFRYFVDEDTCCFERIEKDGSERSYKIDLVYCAQPHPEREPYDQADIYMEWLDDHWQFVFQRTFLSSAAADPPQDVQILPQDWWQQIPEFIPAAASGADDACWQGAKRLLADAYGAYIDEYRGELETVAKEMLRLNAQSVIPYSANTFYSPGAGVQYDAAETDVDVGALEARIRRLGEFDSISVTHDMCCFKFIAGDDAGNTFHIRLIWCERQPEYEPDPDPYYYLTVLDDQWAFECIYAPAEADSEG